LFSAGGVGCSWRHFALSNEMGILSRWCQGQDPIESVSEIGHRNREQWPLSGHKNREMAANQTMPVTNPRKNAIDRSGSAVDLSMSQD